MIISYKHKFIFMHSRKVAGSSIKVALSSVLGSDDLVIGSLDEICNAGLVVPESMSNLLRIPSVKTDYFAARMFKGRSKEWALNYATKKYFEKTLGKNPPHASAEIVARMFPEEWNSFYKFGFVRNPFEQVVSDYYWRLRSTKNSSGIGFLEYLKDLLDGSGKTGLVHPGGISNWDILTINDEVVLDFVGRFESLSDDFEKICERLNIRCALGVAAQKSGGGRSKYPSIYNDEARELVRLIFDRELNEFGYEFPYGT